MIIDNEIPIWDIKMLKDVQTKGCDVCPCWKKKDSFCDLEPFECYEHDGGIGVEGYNKLQWVYFHCSRCGYDWAFWKVLNRIGRKEAEVKTQ